MRGGGGVLMGGRAGGISNRVQHSYWSLDTNKGRAKEDLLDVPPLPPLPLLLSCSGNCVA